MHKTDPDNVTHSMTCRSIAATHRLAAALAQTAQLGDVLSLAGSLGAGKTTFSSGFVPALRGGENIRVSSPTFTSVNTYNSDPIVYHIDLYRLSENIDPDMLGYEEYLEGDGICLIEWLERAPSLAPEDFLQLQLQHRSGHARRVHLQAFGPRSQQWMQNALFILAKNNKK